MLFKKTFNDGNQIAMWVKKDKGENVKVEFQFADGSSVTTSLQWVSPEDGWKYMVFDLNNPPAPVPTKDIAKPSIFKVEGQGNLVTMISELTIGNEDFTQYESPKVSAQFYLVDESGEEIAFGEEFNADIFSGSLTYSVAPTVTESIMNAGTYYAKVVWVFKPVRHFRTGYFLRKSLLFEFHYGYACTAELYVFVVKIAYLGLGCKVFAYFLPKGTCSCAVQYT